jgi:hypothetical protein
MVALTFPHCVAPLWFVMPESGAPLLLADSAIFRAVPPMPVRIDRPKSFNNSLSTRRKIFATIAKSCAFTSARI